MAATPTLPTRSTSSSAVLTPDLGSVSARLIVVAPLELPPAQFPLSSVQQIARIFDLIQMAVQQESQEEVSQTIDTALEKFEAELQRPDRNTLRELVHEIRNVLHSIKLSADLEDWDQARESVQQVKAKIEAKGRVIPQYKTESFLKLCESIRRFTGCCVMAPKEEILIVVDPFFIQSVLLNLVRNAQRENGNPQIVIAREGSGFSFQVIDKGKGFRDKEGIRRAFEKQTYEQVIGSTPIQDNGIGLARAVAEVRAMGGELFITSIADVGTTVEFSFSFQEVKTAKVASSHLHSSCCIIQ